MGENALFRLAHDDIVVRIARNADVLKDAKKEVAVASWLRDLGIPAAEPTDHTQPIMVQGHPVTFWHLIDDSGARPSLSDLATILRQLHRASVPPTLQLPDFDIFDRVSDRIAKAPELTDAERDFLASRLTHLRTEYESVKLTLPPAAVHGDAHQSNLIQRPDGKVLLIDFERFAFGPPESDLAVTATEYLIGWHTDVAYASFCDTYGLDITRWDGFPVIRAINELKMATWLMQNVGVSDQVAAEFRTRLASLCDDNSPRNWRPF
ncbi:MAG TPA: aminoglycoside phosphotransferase family protein [Streptosporangiaceae bacterium]|nr:aminoglycoside phosphotransferase family protein [Streptosporangiaceae bacterium]